MAARADNDTGGDDLTPRRLLLTTVAGDAVDNFYYFFYWTMAAGPTRPGAHAGRYGRRDAAEDFDASAASAGAWDNSARETASDGPPGRCTGGRGKQRRLRRGRRKRKDNEKWIELEDNLNKLKSRRIPSW